jgi:hypothetical protein
MTEEFPAKQILAKNYQLRNYRPITTPLMLFYWENLVLFVFALKYNYFFYFKRFQQEIIFPREPMFFLWEKFSAICFYVRNATISQVPKIRSVTHMT